MRVARLVAARDDGVARLAAGFLDSDVDEETQALRRERFAAMDERAALDAGGAEDFFRRRETHGAQAVAGADGSGFGGGLELALGEEQAVGELQAQAGARELGVEAGREVVRDAEALRAEFAGEAEDHLGDAGARAELRPGLLQPVLARQHDVEAPGAFHAAEFERALHGVFLAAGAEGHERVMHRDAAVVEHVGAGVGVGVEQGRERGGHRDRRIEF